MNFKIVVTRNIGYESVNTFGKVGTVLEVKDGELIDIENFVWDNLGKYFKSIDDVNKLFSEADCFTTKFELVEE